MSRPAARLPAPNGYRGEVARKSRNRGGARSAPTASGQAARVAPDDTAPAGAAPSGTAQLTAPAVAEPDPSTADDKKTETYPGQRFGLPERGPGSVSSMPRRILALFIDWLLCTVIAYWLTHSQFWTI